MNGQRYAEEEVDLRDYIRIVVKRKKSVLGIFFVCIIAAGVVSFLMPKIYSVSQIIEAPMLGVTTGYRTEIMYLNLTDVGEKISSGGYAYKIKEALQLSPQEIITFKVKMSKRGKFMTISMEAPEDEREQALSISEELFRQLSEEYRPVIEAKGKEAESKIISKEVESVKDELAKKRIKEDVTVQLNKIEQRKEKINSLNSRITIVEERADSLLEEIQQAQVSAGELIRRHKFLEAEGAKDSIAALLYANNRYQAKAHINRLNNQLNGLRLKKVSWGEKIKLLGKEIDTIKVQIEGIKIRKAKALDKDIQKHSEERSALQASKALIKNISQVQFPQCSVSPIKPKKKLNIGGAGVLGLILGMMIAWLQESGKGKAGS